MKHRLSISLLVFGSVVVSFLLWEVLLRLIGFSAPRFYTSDQLLGHRLIPKAEGWFRKEGNAYIRINSEGWRDREHMKSKPEHVLRIAVLGDSYAEALQVSLEETFWSVLEKEINRRKCFQKKSIEILNFGVSGYGTGQEWLVLQHYVWEYDPDIVLLAYFPGNDIRNNSKHLEPDRTRPFFEMRIDGLELDRSHAASTAERKPQRFWLKSLRQVVYQHIKTYQLLSALKRRGSGGNKKDTQQQRIPGDEEGVDIPIYSPPKSPEWSEAWELTTALLLSISNEVKAHGKRFVVMVLTTGIQVHPEQKVRQTFMDAIHLESLLYPTESIQTFCKKHGIEVVPLLQDFRRYAEQQHCMLHGFENADEGFGHWNQHGHRLAGKLLADYFCTAPE